MRTVAWVLIAAAATIGALIAQKPAAGGSTDGQETVSVRNVAPPGKLIAPFPDVSSHLMAKAYYDESALQLSKTAKEYGDWTLPSVARYLGYPDLRFMQSPCDLMKSAEADDILSARYFAPKTSSVSAAGRPSELGWRQIIRLRARPASEAMTAGIGAAFVLLNYQQLAANVAGDPFQGRPQYTQVMLTRSAASPMWPGYWLLFDEAAVRIPSITATFHGGDVSAEGQTFSLPEACGQCHGRQKATPHLNFFDVDQWYDRASKSDDFAIVRRSPAAVASTGSCGVSPMQVFQKLNREVQAYNAAPATNAAPFVRAAVTSWVDKHGGPAKVLKPIKRAYGDKPWRSRKDAKLLDMLNRYCYRCHGTTRFDVFDKSAVVARRDTAIKLIRAGRMPLDRQDDRQLSPNEKAKLIDLLKDLK